MIRERGSFEKEEVLSLDRLITLSDLKNVKEELLAEIRKIKLEKADVPIRKWLKSSDVRKLLAISPGKLLALRASRQLAFVRLGGVIYYDRDDINKMVEKAKTAALDSRP